MTKTLEQEAQTAGTEVEIPPGYVRCNYDNCNKIIRKEDAFHLGPGVYCPECKERWFYSED